MTNEDRQHLAALCKSAAEDAEGSASELLSRAAAALSLPEPGIVTRDDIDAALGCMDAIADGLEKLYALFAPIGTAIAAEAAKAQKNAK